MWRNSPVQFYCMLIISFCRPMQRFSLIMNAIDCILHCILHSSRPGVSFKVFKFNLYGVAIDDGTGSSFWFIEDTLHVNSTDIRTGAENIPLPGATYCVTLQTRTGASFEVIKCNCNAFLTAFGTGAEI